MKKINRPHELAVAVACIIILSSTWSVTAAPYTSSELRQVEQDKETQIRSLRDQEVQQLRTTLGRRMPENRRSDLYLRLAELYMEAYRGEFILEGRVHDQRLQNPRGNQKAEKFIDRTSSRKFLAAAIQACREVLKYGIAKSKEDRVYYFLGYGLQEQEKASESLFYFNALIEKYPQSPLVGEAYRELGDAAYDRRNYPAARRFFEEASMRVKGDALPRVYHKLAWVKYRQKDFSGAILSMTQAIKLLTESGEKLVSVKEEALRDMAIFMTEADQAEEAIEYFSKVAGTRDYYPRILEKLGRQYERNLETKKASQVYETLLKTNPENEAAFRVSVKLIDLEIRTARYEDALKRFYLTKIHFPNQKEVEKDTEVAYKNLRAQIRHTATDAHEKYRKKNQPEFLSRAEKFYEAYLNVILKADDNRGETSEIQMYLADVKRELGKAATASELYRAVLERSKHSKDPQSKKYADQAGKLWTASLSEAIKKAGPQPNTQSPSALEEEFVVAADGIASGVEDQKMAREASLRAAQVLAGYPKTKQQAIDRIYALIEKWPDSAQAVTGARLLLQIYKDQKKSNTELQSLAEALLKNEALIKADSNFGEGKLQSQIKAIRTQAAAGEISSLEKNSDFYEAAVKYELLAKRESDPVLIDKAYAGAFHAALVSVSTRTEAFPLAIRIIKEWPTRLPSSAAFLASVQEEATLSFIRGDFLVSAYLLETQGNYQKIRLGKKMNSAQKGVAKESESELFYIAAHIQAALGDLKAERANLRAAIDLHPLPVYFLELAQSFEKESLFNEALLVYRQCSKVQGGEACQAELADLFLQLKDEGQAKREYEKLVVTKSGTQWAAFGAFKLAEILEGTTHFDPLKLPEAVLQKQVEERLKFFERLSVEYQKTSFTKKGGSTSIWSLQAQLKLANWVLRFVNELESIEHPEESARKRFKAGIEALSQPLKKQAQEIALKAWKSMQDSGVLSSASVEAASLLATQSPEFLIQSPRSPYKIVSGQANGPTEVSLVREKLLSNSLQPSLWVDYGNALWTENKPILAEIAYLRASALNGSGSKNSAAKNNLAVMRILNGGQEDYKRVAEAEKLLLEVLKEDPFHPVAKANLAWLYQYYRQFSRAEKLWAQLIAQKQNDPAAEGQLWAQAFKTKNLEPLTNPNLKLGSKLATYHRALQALVRTNENSREVCGSELEAQAISDLVGFEKESFLSLKGLCK